MIPWLGVFPVPDAEQRDLVVEQVLLADRLGLDLVGIQDHPYQRRHLDAWTLISFLAGRTERIRFFPDVANLPLRRAALLAKATASLDLLTGGRVELGLGAGAFWDGIGAWDGPVLSGPQSVDAVEEAIPIIRRVWAGQRNIRAEGAHHSLHGAHGGPEPAHRIGIWLGAYGPRMLRTVGRLADGWVPSLARVPLDELPAKMRLIDDAARRAERDPQEIRRIANVNGVIEDGPASGWLRGPAEHWIDELTRLTTEVGFDGFVFWPDHPDVLGQTERFATEVAPAVRERTA